MDPLKVAFFGLRAITNRLFQISLRSFHLGSQKPHHLVPRLFERSFLLVQSSQGVLVAVFVGTPLIKYDVDLATSTQIVLVKKLN